MDFYSTYEELKLILFLAISQYFSLIFTLPMRNWNMLSDFSAAILFLFLLYLWGIETKNIDLAVLQVTQIFTLPMRNWNLL